MFLRRSQHAVVYNLDVDRPAAVDGGDVVDVDNVHNNIQLSTPDDKAVTTTTN